jgi:hypothetical protein
MNEESGDFGLQIESHLELETGVSEASSEGWVDLYWESTLCAGTPFPSEHVRSLLRLRILDAENRGSGSSCSGWCFPFGVRHGSIEIQAAACGWLIPTPNDTHRQSTCRGSRPGPWRWNRYM